MGSRTLDVQLDSLLAALHAQVGWVWEWGAGGCCGGTCWWRERECEFTMVGVKSGDSLGVPRGGAGLGPSVWLESGWVVQRVGLKLLSPESRGCSCRRYSRIVCSVAVGTPAWRWQEGATSRAGVA